MTSARCIAWVGGEPTRKLAVARRLVDVSRSFRAFDFEGKQYLSRTVDEAMKAAEHYDRAEHLAKVVAYLVRREAPKFTANPKAWIETRRELRT